MNMQPQIVHNNRPTGVPVRIAKAFLERLRGLIPDHSREYALVLPKCSSIHTFFMHYPLDIYFLDKHGKVLKALHNLPPKKLVFPVRRCATVVEIPVALALQKGISADAGDTLDIGPKLP